ncbi:hypothetical protein EB796_007242 [Bugula neritina]|uniref:Uncharacterized protein n=1 Tax=Bugula neritina TaxID=10212 RepID=A0A7J7K9B9_BUGNE|nr:hypothetical protein EB796_007242 [Bugula neritina]
MHIKLSVLFYLSVVCIVNAQHDPVVATLRVHIKHILPQILSEVRNVSETLEVEIKASDFKVKGNNRLGQGGAPASPPYMPTTVRPLTRAAHSHIGGNPPAGDPTVTHPSRETLLELLRRILGFDG